MGSGPMFTHINRVLTALWGAAFALMTLSTWLAVRYPAQDDWFNWVVPRPLLVAAVKFTERYPESYKARRTRGRGSRPRLSRPDPGTGGPCVYDGMGLQKPPPPPPRTEGASSSPSASRCGSSSWCSSCRCGWSGTARRHREVSAGHRLTGPSGRALLWINRTDVQSNGLDGTCVVQSWIPLDRQLT
ncbi:hypothetical protein LT493_33195 [Streptomyces tricolor]|nr:hypothetical protein [Streptomyces tricolor]